jgi:regulator of replication initiation timing
MESETVSRKNMGSTNQVIGTLKQNALSIIESNAGLKLFSLENEDFHYQRHPKALRC